LDALTLAGSQEVDPEKPDGKIDDQSNSSKASALVYQTLFCPQMI